MVEAQYIRAQQLLKDKSQELEILAQALLEKEVLLKSDVQTLIGPRPHEEVADVVAESSHVSDETPEA